LNRSWKHEVGSWKLEVGSWKLEVGSWKLEVGSWKLEVGSWKLRGNLKKIIMISYNPKEWFTFIFKFHKSDTVRKLLPLLLGIGIY